MRSQDSFDPSQLHVVAIVHNPLRYKSRHRLFQSFVEQCRSAGVTLHVVEASFGERQDDHGPDTLVVQDHEVWIKESLINVGFSRLPRDWKYAAWIDGDVQFTRPDWAVETIHQLQHYRVVQMFATAADLGPDGQIIQTFNGFGYSRAAGLPELLNASSSGYAADYYYDGRDPQQVSQGKFWHPGFAWAMRRDAFDNTGGLIDWSALGSADHIMALAWIGKVEKAIPSGLHPNFLKHAQMYQELCDEHVRRDIGFVPGTLLHHWHGKKRDRRYVDRWEILKRHQYDPERDVVRSSQGIVRFTRAGERMRDDMRAYFRARNEDSIDMEE